MCAGRSSLSIHSSRAALVIFSIRTSTCKAGACSSSLLSLRGRRAPRASHADQAQRSAGHLPLASRGSWSDALQRPPGPARERQPARRVIAAHAGESSCDQDCCSSQDRASPRRATLARTAWPLRRASDRVLPLQRLSAGPRRLSRPSWRTRAQAKQNPRMHWQSYTGKN